MNKRLLNYADRLVIEYPGVPRQLIERVCFAVYSFHQRDVKKLIEKIEAADSLESWYDVRDAIDDYKASLGDET